MKSLYKLSYPSAVVLLLIFLLLNACKKDGLSPGNKQNKTDSLKFYTWYINISDSANIPLYLWYKQVPENFPWWSDQYATATEELNAIRNYATVEGKKVDRYSFLDLTGAVSGELQAGVKGDFGFGFEAVMFQDNQVHLIVSYVYRGSPAGLAGIKRGWDIISVNGNSNITWDGSKNYQDLIDGLYFSPHSTFVFSRPDKPDTTVSLVTDTYDIQAVLFDSIYTVSHKKVGYFVYNMFVNVTNTTNGAKEDLDRVFSKFDSAGIQELIVDLRYNGGGSLPTVEYLDNKIAPASAAGQEMYKTLYNDKLTAYFNYWKTQGDTTAVNAVEPVKFSAAAHQLNLSRVFFIVGRGTASAAELTINNLTPYMQVKLIGDTTYGKPVGFFGIPISYVTDTAGFTQVATMYAINFRTINKNGKGDYYSGMVPDYYYPFFDISGWGDKQKDKKLAAALNFIETGSFQRTFNYRKKTPSENQLRIMHKHRASNPHEFKGMVDYRKTPLILPKK